MRVPEAVDALVVGGDEVERLAQEGHRPDDLGSGLGVVTPDDRRRRPVEGEHADVAQAGRRGDLVDLGRTHAHARGDGARRSSHEASLLGGSGVAQVEGFDEGGEQRVAGGPLRGVRVQTPLDDEDGGEEEDRGGQAETGRGPEDDEQVGRDRIARVGGDDLRHEVGDDRAQRSGRAELDDDREQGAVDHACCGRREAHLDAERFRPDGAGCPQDDSPGGFVDEAADEDVGDALAEVEDAFDQLVAIGDDGQDRDDRGTHGSEQGDRGDLHDAGGGELQGPDGLRSTDGGDDTDDEHGEEPAQVLRRT